jgi:hypothetical protein
MIGMSSVYSQRYQRNREECDRRSRTVFSRKLHAYVIRGDSSDGSCRHLVGRRVRAAAAVRGSLTLGGVGEDAKVGLSLCEVGHGTSIKGGSGDNPLSDYLLTS